MKDMLTKLFRFPIIMVDGDIEEKKTRAAESAAMEIGDPEIVYGEAECPYYDFVSINDRWLPSDESFDNAVNKQFDACGVVFAQSGTFLCPWTKKQFKREFQKFLDQLPEEEPITLGSYTLQKKDDG